MGEPGFERAPREMFAFRPSWNWDPPPELLRGLDKSILIELAQVKLQVEIQMLQAHLDAAKQTAEILAKNQ